MSVIHSYRPTFRTTSAINTFQRFPLVGMNDGWMAVFSSSPSINDVGRVLAYLMSSQASVLSLLNTICLQLLNDNMAQVKSDDRS